MPRKKEHGKLKVVVPPGACVFCCKDQDDEETYGQFIRSNDMSVHYFCMLFASGLCQNGEEEEQGIMGFLVSDINKEVRRAARLRCVFCKRPGATIGCVMSRCRMVFHFPCGLDNGVLNAFTGKFCSYCELHRPRQTVQVSDRLAFYGTAKTSCPICMCSVEARSSNHTLRAPCCKNSWFHKQCLQRHASCSGLHFFKCPLCNNREVFQEEMLNFGIYIPDQDAAWEREPNAFQELLQRYSHCDTPSCKCPQGRDYTKNDSKWEMMLCDWCGSQGTHLACDGLRTPMDDWVCRQCRSFTTKGKLKMKSVKFKSAKGSQNIRLVEEKFALMRGPSPPQQGKKRKRSSTGSPQHQAKRKCPKTTNDQTLPGPSISATANPGPSTSSATTLSGLTLVPGESRSLKVRGSGPRDSLPALEVTSATQSPQPTQRKPRRSSKYLERHKDTEIDLSNLTEETLQSFPPWLRKFYQEDIFTGRNLGAKFAQQSPVVKKESPDQPTTASATEDLAKVETVQDKTPVVEKPKIRKSRRRTEDWAEVMKLQDPAKMPTWLRNLISQDIFTGKNLGQKFAQQYQDTESAQDTAFSLHCGTRQQDSELSSAQADAETRVLSESPAANASDSEIMPTLGKSCEESFEEKPLGTDGQMPVLHKVSLKTPKSPFSTPTVKSELDNAFRENVPLTKTPTGRSKFDTTQYQKSGDYKGKSHILSPAKNHSYKIKASPTIKQHKLERKMCDLQNSSFQQCTPRGRPCKFRRYSEVKKLPSQDGSINCAPRSFSSSKKHSASRGANQSHSKLSRKGLQFMSPYKKENSPKSLRQSPKTPSSRLSLSPRMFHRRDLSNNSPRDDVDLTDKPRWFYNLMTDDIITGVNLGSKLASQFQGDTVEGSVAGTVLSSPGSVVLGLQRLSPQPARSPPHGVGDRIRVWTAEEYLLGVQLRVSLVRMTRPMIRRIQRRLLRQNKARKVSPQTSSSSSQRESQNLGIGVQSKSGIEVVHKTVRCIAADDRYGQVSNTTSSDLESIKSGSGTKTEVDSPCTAKTQTPTKLVRTSSTPEKTHTNIPDIVQPSSPPDPVVICQPQKSCISLEQKPASQQRKTSKLCLKNGKRTNKPEFVNSANSSKMSKLHLKKKSDAKTTAHKPAMSSAARPESQKSDKASSLCSKSKNKVSFSEYAGRHFQLETSHFTSYCDRVLQYQNYLWDKKFSSAAKATGSPVVAGGSQVFHPDVEIISGSPVGAGGSQVFHPDVEIISGSPVGAGGSQVFHPDVEIISGSPVGAGGSQVFHPDVEIISGSPVGAGGSQVFHPDVEIISGSPVGAGGRRMFPPDLEIVSSSCDEREDAEESDMTSVLLSLEQLRPASHGSKHSMGEIRLHISAIGAEDKRISYVPSADVAAEGNNGVVIIPDSPTPPQSPTERSSKNNTALAITTPAVTIEIAVEPIQDNFQDNVVEKEQTDTQNATEREPGSSGGAEDNSAKVLCNQPCESPAIPLMDSTTTITDAGEQPEPSPLLTSQDNSPSTEHPAPSPLLTSQDNSPSTEHPEPSPLLTSQDNSPSTEHPEPSPLLTSQDNSPSTDHPEPSPLPASQGNSPSTEHPEPSPLLTSQDNSPSTEHPEPSPLLTSQDNSPSTEHPEPSPLPASQGNSPSTEHPEPSPLPASQGDSPSTEHPEPSPLPASQGNSPSTEHPEPSPLPASQGNSPRAEHQEPSSLPAGQGDSPSTKHPEPSPLATGQGDSPSTEHQEPSPLPASQGDSPSTKHPEPSPLATGQGDSPSTEHQEPSPLPASQGDSPSTEHPEPSPLPASQGNSPSTEHPEPSPLPASQGDSPSTKHPEPSPLPAGQGDSPSTEHPEPSPLPASQGNSPSTEHPEPSPLPASQGDSPSTEHPEPSPLPAGQGDSASAPIVVEEYEKSCALDDDLIIVSEKIAPKVCTCDKEKSLAKNLSPPQNSGLDPKEDLLMIVSDPEADENGDFIKSSSGRSIADVSPLTTTSRVPLTARNSENSQSVHTRSLLHAWSYSSGTVIRQTLVSSAQHRAPPPVQSLLSVRFPQPLVEMPHLIPPPPVASPYRPKPPVNPRYLAPPAPAPCSLGLTPYYEPYLPNRVRPPCQQPAMIWYPRQPAINVFSSAPTNMYVFTKNATTQDPRYQYSSHEYMRHDNYKHAGA